MSCVTESAMMVLDEPITVTAQQFPFALMVFKLPLTIRVASLQSTVCSRLCPITWVSPFFAWATGCGAASVTVVVMTQVASDPATVVQFTAGPFRFGGCLLD